jgi:glycine/D-amino acid oxidase-like deaminating enzyme
MVDDNEPTYRDKSLWLAALDGPLTPRSALDGDVSCDVAIVGAGFTGLWTAYYLKRLQPDLHVIVVEREIAGFGPSGRNGGWVSAFIAGSPGVYERRSGHDAVLRAERETFATVTEIGRVVSQEQITCGFEHTGSLSLAFTAPQLDRLVAGVRSKHARGLSDADITMLERDEISGYVRARDPLGASFTPHCARVDPARLVRGLADACERIGVVIHEGTPALGVEPRRVRCPRGTITAGMVVRATEAYTTELAGEARRFLPLYSLMIATEPLDRATLDELGWANGLTVSDQHHLFFYAQCTTDGRIAIGGRGAPYRLGAPISEAYERNSAVRERLTASIRRHFPAVADAEVTHAWGGPLGVPRDWCMSVVCDRAAGFAWAGGYSGHGVVATNIAGRTLADLIIGRDTDLVHLPWVDHVPRRWEPEPLRFLAASAIVSVLGSADGMEDRTGRRARRTTLVKPFVMSR